MQATQTTLAPWISRDFRSRRPTRQLPPQRNHTKAHPPHRTSRSATLWSMQTPYTGLAVGMVHRCNSLQHRTYGQGAPSRRQPPLFQPRYVDLLFLISVRVAVSLLQTRELSTTPPGLKVPGRLPSSSFHSSMGELSSSMCGPSHIGTELTLTSFFLLSRVERLEDQTRAGLASLEAKIQTMIEQCRHEREETKQELK